MGHAWLLLQLWVLVRLHSDYALREMSKFMRSLEENSIGYHILYKRCIYNLSDIFQFDKLFQHA